MWRIGQVIYCANHIAKMICNTMRTPDEPGANLVGIYALRHNFKEEGYAGNYK